MPIITIVLVLASFAALFALATRIAFMVQAIKRADKALLDLSEELRAVDNRSLERYRVHLPGQKDFDAEHGACRSMLKQLTEKLDALMRKPLRVKLSKAWIAECNRIGLRAENEIRGLQDEAFWAQFPLGSDARRARFDAERLGE